MGLRSRRSTRFDVALGRCVAVLLIMGLFGALASGVDDARPTKAPDKTKPVTKKDDATKKEQPKPTPVKLGLSINDPRAFRGYTLLNPMNQKMTYLIDLEGRVVKSWESSHKSSHPAYLLEDGHLFRVATLAGHGAESLHAAHAAAAALLAFAEHTQGRDLAHVRSLCRAWGSLSRSRRCSARGEERRAHVGFRLQDGG